MTTITGKNPITDAMKNKERLAEIRQRLDELREPRQQAKREVDRHIYEVEQLEREARSDGNAYGWRRKHDEVQADLSKEKTRLKVAQEAFNPIQAEIESLESEAADLQLGCVIITTKDLQSAKKAVDDTKAQIERVERALEEVVIEDPSDLQEEHDALAAERDLLAADVALGDSPQTELTAMEKQLTALGKKLAGAQEAKRNGESTTRGYTAKLERLKTDLVTAEEAFKEVIGHWLTSERESAVVVFNEQLKKLGLAYADMCALNSIARRTGATLRGRTPSELKLSAARYEDLPDDFEHTYFTPGETSDQLATQRMKKAGIQ